MAARFLMSAPSVGQLHSLGLPEVAFAGRSNVGKSSLVGNLMGSPTLVRTSRTPGRTQLLNLFSWDARLSVIDLPGYGYAKLSHTQRAQMASMMRNYVALRRDLAGVVLVLDARRTEVSAQDREMAAWVLRHGRALLLAITKADLVPKTRRLGVVRQIETGMGVPAGWAHLCSSRAGDGIVELRKRLWELAEA